MIHPFKRILLATEHTEFDAGAERIAMTMARQCGLPLRVILPILSNPEYEMEAPQLVIRTEREAATKIAALRGSADEIGVQLDIHVRRGAQIHAEIVAEAVAAQTDLIVIRRRGNPSFLSNLLVGEMVSKVIRDANCAVLTVPRAAEFWKHGIIAAVGNTPSAHDTVMHAANIAAACGLPLTLVSIAANQEALADTEALNARHVSLASSITAKVQGRVTTGKPAEQAVAIAKELSADLIVIGRQRYNVIPFSLGGSSIMQKIAGALAVTTLIVP